MKPHEITFADLESNPILGLLGAAEGDTLTVTKPGSGDHATGGATETPPADTAVAAPAEDADKQEVDVD